MPFNAVLISLLALLVLLPLALLNASHLSPDCAIYLDCAQRILAGQLPYVDFWDPNPPLIMYLSVPPVLLAKYTGLSVVESFMLSVWLFVVGAFFALKKVLSLTDDSSGSDLKVPILTAFAC